MFLKESRSLGRLDLSAVWAFRSADCYNPLRMSFRMTFYHFEIVVEKESDDVGYAAYSPTLPGCFSNGKTIEEAGGISAKPSNST